MGLFQTQKAHSAGKHMVPAGEELSKIVLNTLSRMANMAGQTLGPGGKQVLIERPEMNMKPIVTKDGVTVIKSLGFDNALQQVVLESARDAAMHTASVAGDGTTTATVLSHAIAVQTYESVKKNSRMSPQRIVREMQELVPYLIQKVKDYSILVNGENYSEVLKKVATLSGNGDEKLAESIMQAHDLVGDEGNITIVEANGPAQYVVSKINGYTLEIGYEETVKHHANGFINDKTGTLVKVKNPIFLLFDGVITDMSQIIDPMQKLYNYMEENRVHERNIVLVAHGFSDPFIGDLHVNWADTKSTMKILPLLTPQKAIMNWRTAILHDLSAYTGAPVFNPVSAALIDMDCESLVKKNKVTEVEVGRFRTSIIAEEDELAIELRVEELKQQRLNPESDYELNDLNVRIAALTSGIARLIIYGPSAAETREKRDRADDAWCAIRGAIKEGAVPGGGYVLVRLAADLVGLSLTLKEGPKKTAVDILSKAVRKPVELLYSNYGYNEQEVDAALAYLLRDDSKTFNIAEETWVERYELLDSVPAVTQAIQNSVSIAALLGTLGGIISFKRDGEADAEEQKFARNFERAIGENT
jgi:chaperonin GroEL